mgnify:CR=1 FL=1
MREIGKELKDYFKKKGLTQKEVAEKSGVPATYITKLFSGERGFGEKMAMKWETLFGLSHVYLMTGEGEMEVGTGVKPDVPYIIYQELLDRYESVVRENEQLRARLKLFEPVEKRSVG